jgi:hypothetical protein
MGQDWEGQKSCRSSEGREASGAWDTEKEWYGRWELQLVDVTQLLQAKHPSTVLRWILLFLFYTWRN